MITANVLREKIKARKFNVFKEIETHFEAEIAKAADKNLYETSVQFDKWHHMRKEIEAMLHNNGYGFKDCSSQKDGCWMAVYWDKNY